MNIDNTGSNPKYEPHYSGEGSLSPIDAIMLALLFHSGSPWDDAKRAEWFRITGTTEATTKVLCDHLRAVVATMTEPLDDDRVEFLAKRFMGIVRSHYLEGPTGRDRVLEVLNALACAVAFVLTGTGDDSAQEFFNKALENQIEEILARKEQSDE